MPDQTKTVKHVSSFQSAESAEKRCTKTLTEGIELYSVTTVRPSEPDHPHFLREPLADRASDTGCKGNSLARLCRYRDQDRDLELDSLCHGLQMYSVITLILTSSRRVSMTFSPPSTY
jgi:hypothetical protein